MAKLDKKYRDSLVDGLRQTRATMHSWMTVLFRVAMCLGVLAFVGVILLYTLTEREAAAMKLAGIAALLLIGAIKLGIDMTRCELQFHSLETAIAAGAVNNATRAIRGFRCFGALEKFTDELTKYIQRDGDGESDGPE